MEVAGGPSGMMLPMATGTRYRTIGARATTTAALVATSLLVTGCVAPAEHPVRPRALPTAIPSTLAVAVDRPVTDPWRALALVPVTAEFVTITDFDAIRARLGAQAVTSASSPAEREAFWAKAARESVLLSTGLFSRSSDVHSLVQDDVAWEVRFDGPEGEGYVVAFRPGLDLDRVRGALGAPVMAGARLLEPQNLLVRNTAGKGERVWAMEPAVARLAVTSADGAPAESAYVRRGCVPLRTALGAQATYAEEQKVVAAEDPRFLRPLRAFVVEYADDVATARLGVDRLDLHQRAGLVAAWPETGNPSVAEAFEGFPAADPATGRIGLRVTDPQAAAAVTLAGRLPFAICNQSP